MGREHDLINYFTTAFLLAELKQADWFDGLIITLEEDGNTLFTGLVVDQAALHGMIKKVRDLGMSLLSVNRIEPGQKQ